MNRADLELMTEHVESTERLIAAKETYRKKPTAGNKAKMDEAKREARELTIFWRGIRTFFKPDETVPTVTAKARSH